MEEVVEQNYNMIDNVINNTKPQEEPHKQDEQKKAPKDRQSLRERLEEKKRVIAQFPVPQDENGKRIYETEKTRVPNKYLKGMVEFYKGRGKDKEEEIGDGGAAAAPASLSANRPSMKDRLAEKKSNARQMIKVTGPKSMQRPKEVAL